MSAFDPMKKLQEDVSSAKVILEHFLKKIEELEKIITAKYNASELSFGDFNDLIRPASNAHGIIEGKLKNAMDMVLVHAKVQTGKSVFTIGEVLKKGSWVDVLEILKMFGLSLNTLFEKPLPTVVIGKKKARGEQSSRSIDNLLYSYTPYKLRGTKEDYSMLLLPSQRGDSIRTDWFSGEIYSYHENGVKVVTPDEIRLTDISNLQHPIFINGEPPFKLELERRTADEAYYCTQGYYVSYKTVCQRRECQLWAPCQGRRFWAGPRPLQALARVMPEIVVTVDEHASPRTVLSLAEDVLRVEIIDELTAKIFIKAVAFLSSYMARAPIIRPKETIGYRARTRSIAFSLDFNWLKTMIERLLNVDASIFNWIYAKYFIRENFDVNDVAEVTGFFWNLISSSKDRNVSRFESGIKRREVTEELVNFAIELLIHTLSHMLHEQVVAELQTSSDNVIYSYTVTPDKEGRLRIFLFENAEGGLGLTESFESMIKRSGSTLINRILDSIRSVQLPCYKLLLTPVYLDTADEDVKKVFDRVDFYNETLYKNFGIHCPVEITRYILAREDKITMDILRKQELTTYIDDILSSTPICWDGCYSCVRLETDCHNAPYEQMFGVSKNLLLAILQRLTKNLPSHQVSYVRIGEASEVINYIKGASYSVLVISPWISRELAEQVLAMAKQTQLQLRILTWLDLNVETHKKALEIFQTSKMDNLHVRVLTDKKLHAKMVAIDEKLVILGSVNLTLSGLNDNIESYIVETSPNIVKDSVSQFEELWKQARNIKEVKLEP